MFILAILTLSKIGKIAILAPKIFTSRIDFGKHLSDRIHEYRRDGGVLKAVLNEYYA